MNGFSQLFEELKRRKVIRSLTLYAIVLWPIIQVVDIMSPALGLPDSLMRYLVFAFLGGVPLVVILSWMFDLGRTKSDAQAETSLLWNRSEWALIGVLVVFVAGLFIIQLQMDEASKSNQLTPLSESNTSVYRSIAVLPFAVFSADPQDQFFSDGLTEELLNVLARIKQIKVAARTSSFAYKGVNKNVQLIGQELNVDTILEGSVRRNDVDGTIRVTAQLIDVKDGTHLWSKTFDREFVDLFKIQDDISQAVATELSVELLGRDSGDVNPATTVAEAAIAYSMGRTELAKRTQASMLDATRYFEQAVKFDPQYAAAYSGLADAYSLRVNYKFDTPAVGLKNAWLAIEHALEIDDTLGMAWASKGLIQTQEHDKQAARVSLAKAIELSPNYALAYMWYAGTFEDPKQALIYYQKAHELDPKSAVAGLNVANLLLDEGRDVEAMAVFAKIVEADPFFAKAYQIPARVSDRRGRIVEAIRQFEKSYELGSESWVALKLARLYSDVGNFSAADHWFSLISVESAPYLESSLKWAKISRYSADKQEPKARELLLAITKNASSDPRDQMAAAMAAYYNEDLGAVISFFEAAQSSWEQIVTMDNKVDLGELEYGGILSAAYAYKKLGHAELATRLLAKLEAGFAKRLQSSTAEPGDWYQRAVGQAIAGKEEVALLYLQRAVDMGWREYWRPAFEPALAELNKTPAFKSMLAGLETRMAIIRNQFEIEAQFAADFSG